MDSDRITMTPSLFDKLNTNFELYHKDTFNLIQVNHTDKNAMINNSKKQNNEYFEILLSRNIFIEVFNSIHEGIQIIDDKGIIVYVNPAFLKILGVDPSDRIGKKIMDVSPDGSLVEVLRTKKSVVNLKNSPKGTTTELLSNATPLYINNQFIGAVATTRDIKDVKTLSDKLEQSEKMVKSLSERISFLSKVKFSFEDIVSESESMKKVIELAKIASRNDSGVLILGETGTGKEIIANAIHNMSTRDNKPFITVNCSAISSTLLESTFFGHEKGSFTGAYKRQLGVFELANGGTLFLDEIGDMNFNLQAKILRAIQEKEIQRVGGEKKIPLDVRIIAATNRDLDNMMQAGAFRSDLYYRLNVLDINIPPLRERKADIDALANYFLTKICRRLGKERVSINDEAMEVLHNYSWPGNVRELENILERAVLCNKGMEILPNDLDCIKNSLNDIVQSCQIESLANMEKEMIVKALNNHGSSYLAKKEIAQKLGISLASLYNKIKKYKI
ncbi:MAG: sigma 54-interacting transcriptional regulator [Bacillota bacterium]|nr:sigma 54-interacting transcriptional regulator [Bacillota bacterium]